jgi:hypothetical protein
MFDCTCNIQQFFVTEVPFPTLEDNFVFLTTSRLVMGVSGYIGSNPQGQKWLFEGHMFRLFLGELLEHGTVPDYKHTCKFTSAVKCHVISCRIKKGLQSDSVWKITPIGDNSSKRVLYNSYVQAFSHSRKKHLLPSLYPSVCVFACLS